MSPASYLTAPPRVAAAIVALLSSRCGRRLAGSPDGRRRHGSVFPPADVLRGWPQVGRHDRRSLDRHLVRAERPRDPATPLQAVPCGAPAPPAATRAAVSRG